MDTRGSPRFQTALLYAVRGSRLCGRSCASPRTTRVRVISTLRYKGLALSTLKYSTKPKTMEHKISFWQLPRSSRRKVYPRVRVLPLFLTFSVLVCQPEKWSTVIAHFISVIFENASIFHQHSHINYGTQWNPLSSLIQIIVPSLYRTYIYFDILIKCERSKKYLSPPLGESLCMYLCVCID